MTEDNCVLQDQYDLIHSYFKTTTEAYDDLEWDGEELAVILDDVVVERYSLAELRELIPNFD